MGRGDQPPGRRRAGGGTAWEGGVRGRTAMGGVGEDAKKRWGFLFGGGLNRGLLAKVPAGHGRV